MRLIIPQSDIKGYRFDMMAMERTSKDHGVISIKSSKKRDPKVLSITSLKKRSSSLYNEPDNLFKFDLVTKFLSFFPPFSQEP